jgi:hypothetical protein
MMIRAAEDSKEDQFGGHDGEEYGHKGGPKAFMNILEELMRGLGD